MIRTRRRVRCWRVLLPVALLALAAGCRSATEPHRAVVDSGVLAMLDERGRAEVVVALVDPDRHGAAVRDTAERRARIAAMQREVLESLDPADFRSRTLFEMVPALTGTVLTERGLAGLSSHPLVTRVDLDAQGGGTGGQ